MRYVCWPLGLLVGALCLCAAAEPVYHPLTDRSRTTQAGHPPAGEPARAPEAGRRRGATGQETAPPVFRPSEKIPADTAVPFPADI